MTARPAPSEVSSFVDTARRFCKWCESDKSRVAAQKLHFDALRALADVYRAGFLLPDTDRCDAPKAERVTKAQRKTLSRRLEQLPFQHYWNIRKPSDFEGHKEPVCGDLFDDYLDIYADMIEGLWLYEHGHVQAAVYFWRMSFGERWGHRAVGALHALHTHTLETQG